MEKSDAIDSFFVCAELDEIVPLGDTARAPLALVLLKELLDPVR